MASNPDNVRLSAACRALLQLVATLDQPLPQRQLAARVGCSTMTITRAVARLVAVGYLTRARRDQGFAAHLPDVLAVTPAGRAASTEPHSGSRASIQERKVQQLPPEVILLRSAMRDAGLTAGFGNLYPETVDELVARVRAVGVRALVAEAARHTWGKVRHVAAYLARWRALRAPRPPACPFHPSQPPRGCLDCAATKAAATPMPDWVRQRFAAATRHQLPVLST